MLFWFYYYISPFAIFFSSFGTDPVELTAASPNVLFCFPSTVWICCLLSCGVQSSLHLSFPFWRRVLPPLHGYVLLQCPKQFSFNSRGLWTVTRNPAVCSPVYMLDLAKVAGSQGEQWEYLIWLQRSEAELYQSTWLFMISIYYSLLE